MIDFEFTEEQNLLRESVRAYAKSVEERIIELDHKHESDTSLLYRMGEEGFLGVCIPEKYGGAGMDYISLAILSEELERVDTSLRVPISVHIGLNSLLLLQWGNEEQKQKYLVPQAEGKKLGAFALTESNAGSDPANLSTSAKEDGDYYIINGSKAWISLASVADNYIVFAKTDPSKKHRGITAFIVERNFKGVEGRPYKDKLGVRAGDTGEIFFTDVAVPKENIVGELGEGFKIAMSALDNGRYTVGAGSVGLAKSALEASVNYANERRTFGVPIADHQLIQEKIAIMARNIDAAELLILRAGWMKNKGLRNTRETSMAKWFATEVASQAADFAIQIHGAYGYSGEYPVERYWRNARGARIYEGSDEIHMLIQARYALGKTQDKPLRKMLPPWPFKEE